MKKVFQSNEVAHVWSSQSQFEGRNSSKNIYFEGPTIYSYGSHFPMARFVEPNRVLTTTKTYSVTTAKHLGFMRQAISHLESIRVDNVRANSVSAHKANLDGMVTNIRHAVEKYKRAKTYKDSWLRTIRGRLDDIRLYCTWFKVGNLPNAVKSLRDFEGNDDEQLFALLGETFQAITAAEQRATVRARTAEKKRQREREAKLRESLEVWLTGDTVNVSLYSLPIALRVVEDTIETSHGARVPLQAALGLYAAIQDGKELPEHIGSYGPISHDETNLRVGCHDIPLTECARLKATIAA